MTSTKSLLYPVVIAAFLVAVSATYEFANYPQKAPRKLRVRNRSSSTASRENTLRFRAIPKPVIRTNLHQSVYLECKASGTPSPTIHWLFNGSRILQGSNIITDDAASYEQTTSENEQIVMLKMSSTISRLYLDCVTQSHEGLYTCVADNPTQRRVATTKLKIVRNVDGVENGCLVKKGSADGEPARVYMWTVERLELEGAYVQLFCRASGVPRPRLVWFDRDDNVISPDSRDYKLLPNGDLLVKAITFERNMGVYKCVADNGNGRDSKDTFLYPAGDY